MAVPPPSKNELRHDLRKRRDDFVFQIDYLAIDRLALALTDVLMPHIPSGKSVAAYIPINSEIGTMPMIRALATARHPIALPHVTGRAGTPRFLVWAPDDPLIEGPFGLKQPATDRAEITPDVILTPLLGFDSALNRIGYGAGHYDRAFAAHPSALRIGLAWTMQQCEAIPADPWDIPLHAVATEQSWITR